MASCIDIDDDVQIGGVGQDDDTGQIVRRQHDDAHQVGGGQNNDARCNGTRTLEERFFGCSWICQSVKLKVVFLVPTSPLDSKTRSVGTQAKLRKN